MSLWATDPRIPVIIYRDVPEVTYPLTAYFHGFEDVDAVKRLFGDRTTDVLKGVRVQFRSRRGYMGVSDDDGRILISLEYLKRGDLLDLYLDIIHELVHVKQFLDGRPLRDRRYRYVDRPTEIEAFRHAVAEARRLGMSDARILDYLRTESMKDEDLFRLATHLDVHVRN
jgi:hypothetical protein